MVFGLMVKKSITFRPSPRQRGCRAFAAMFETLSFDPGCELVFERQHHDFF
jgi:hypothetical protein